MSRSVVTLGDLFNVVTAGGTGVFAEAGESLPVLAQSSAIRISLAISANRSASLLVTRGGTTLTVDLNDGMNIGALDARVFTWSGSRGDQYDVEISGPGATILVLRVEEVKGAVL